MAMKDGTRVVRAIAALAAAVVLIAGLAPIASSATASPVSALEAGAPGQASLPSSAAVLSTSDFDAGYIIADSLFYDYNAMSQSQIQSFLDSKCASTCVNTKYTTSADRAATNMCPNGYVGAANESTAAIIYKVQQACGISARAILVILQKETSLVTKANPTDLDMRKAMGFACPDTSVCDSRFYGLFNQIYSAASQLKRYGLRTSDNISFRTKYQIGVPYPILYNPNVECGTKTVTVQNMATTALYYYTPYTPNASALSVLTGPAPDPSCASYGNRNFWVFYNSWFGPSTPDRGQTMINARYESEGGAAGYLGAAGASTCVSGSTACQQSFAGGTIYWLKSTGAWVLNAAYTAMYPGVYQSLGYPTGPYATVTGNPNGDGGGQQFEKGTIYSSAAGNFAVTSYVRNEYWSRGSNGGAMGWPVAAATCLTNFCFQQFQGGVIFGSGSLGTRVITGPNAAAYPEFATQLGFPTSNYVAITTNPNGPGGGQSFTTGTLYSSAAGVFPTWGPVREEWWRSGGNSGPLGWPVADPICSAGLCSQEFQSGTVTQTSATTAITSPRPYVDYTAVYGAFAAQLGSPTTSYIAVTSNPNGAGGGQSFTMGTIYSSAAGAFATWGVVRAEYWRMGGNSGALGWPVGNPVCSGGLCTQEFQNGVVAQTSSTKAVTTARAYPAYASVYSAFASQLGSPTSGYVAVTSNPNGAGGGQSFTMGTIYSSAAGAFATWGAVRAEWWRLGGNSGALGWPIANPVCSGGLCTQQFQNGSVAQTSASTAVAAQTVHPAYAALATTYAFQLGVATSAYIDIPTNPNGAGGGQVFAKGTIYSSAAGAFATWGAVRAKWWNTGGNSGPLGWPIANPVCSAGSCTQAFMGGSLTAAG